jgi:hypothetical protein
VTTRRLDLAAAAANVKAAASGPLDQKSSVFPELTGFSGLPGWSYFIPQERELSEAWRGRKRLETVDEMLNHYQVAACWQAVRLPVHRYVIELAPRRANIVDADLIASDLDVPLQGHEDTSDRDRDEEDFSQRRHLDRALDAVTIGHAVFEQVGYIDQAGTWRLRDLAPVPQWTLDDASWKVDKHGKLLEVVQYGATPEVRIPADHLAVFTWQGAPGDFRGRSILRPLTAPWMLSDRGMRVTGMAMERTGMGIPVGKVGMGAGVQAKQDMERLLRNLAAGENTNLVLETDEDIQKSMMLMGVTGSTPDLVGILRHWDEAIARAMLASLLQLGSTETGSRALGETFDDLLSMFHDTVVTWYCDAMNRLVRLWMIRNRGPDAPRPMLVWKRRDDEGVPAPAPADTPPVPAGPTPVAAKRRPMTAAARHERKAKATRTAFAQAAGRDLRRDPTPAELAAGTDFSRLEREHVAAREDLAAVLLRERDDLAARAVEIIAAMPTVDPLTLGAVLGPQLAGHAAGMDTGPLVTLLEASAAQGQAQVVAEAATQGVTITPDVDYAARAAVEANELQRRMAVQVTEACAAAAKTIVPAAPAVRARRGFMSKLRPPARLATIEAGTIEDFLSSLSPAAAEQAAAGATSRANGGGRFGAIASAPTQAVYASELLDENTCVAPDALVMTAEGEKPAAEITLRDRLLTHAGRYIAPSAIVPSDAKGELVRVLVGGRTLRATPDHRVLVVRGNSLAWREAGELLVGDLMVSEATAQTGSEPISHDVRLGDAPHGEPPRLKVGGFAPVSIGPQRVPVGAVRFDDDRAEEEVHDPRPDLGLGGVAQARHFKDLADDALDTRLGIAGDVASSRAVPLARLGGRHYADGLPAVLTVDKDRRPTAGFAAVTARRLPPVAEGGPASLAGCVASTVGVRAGAGAVVVARRVGRGDVEVRSASDACLRHAVAWAARVTRVVLRATGVRAVLGPTSLSASDLGAASLTDRRGPMSVPACPPCDRGTRSTALTGDDGLAAVHTRLVHKKMVLMRVDATTVTRYVGRVFDFTIPGDHTFFAEGVLVHNCGPCADVDGREYESIEDAMLDYPSLGGFFDCEGGERCRGTAVAVFEGEV